jgi:heme exporter protein D
VWWWALGFVWSALALFLGCLVALVVRDAWRED